MDTQHLNLSLNDNTDYGLCFACGPRNTCGLRLKFERSKEAVITKFCGADEHQGFPGYIHGGIITTLLDEVMSRVFLLDNRWTMTARIEVKFRHPVMLNESITAIGEKVKEHRGILEARGKVELTDGTVAAEAVGTFVVVKNKTLAQMSTDYPILAREWLQVKE